MEKGDVAFLNQLVQALENAELKLEEAYKKQDYENFDASKKLILKVQSKIAEVSK